MDYSIIIEQYWYLVGGILSIILISFTQFRRNLNGFMQISSALLIGWPVVLPLVLTHILNNKIRQYDFMYTINTGLCKKCGKESYIECEIGSSRGDRDSIYTEISCSCRDHNNSWAHFSSVDKIYKHLIKHNPQFTKKNWKVGSFVKEEYPT